MKKLYGMRGLPGSGKSTKARELVTRYKGEGFVVYYLSTDDFWGEPYNFIPAKIGEAHLWNQNRALAAMIEASNPPDVRRGTILIIDNTAAQAWELRPYIKPAMELGFEVEIIEPSTPWAFDADECARKTIHGVPVERIHNMLSRWEYNITPEQCVNSRAPWERNKDVS